MISPPSELPELIQEDLSEDINIMSLDQNEPPNYQIEPNTSPEPSSSKKEIVEKIVPKIQLNPQKMLSF